MQKTDKDVKIRYTSASSQSYNSSPWLKAYVCIVFVILYLPILSVVVFSFNASSSATSWGGFSLKWYEAMFNDSTLLEDLWNTISIALLATVISTLIGTLGSLSLADLNKQKRTHFVNLSLTANNIPIVNPDIVTAVSLMALFLAFQAWFSMNYWTMLLAHIAFCTPYVVLQVYPKVLSQDPAEMEAALDLGATRRQAIFKVVIPDLLPSILSGAMLAFTMSFDDFIISYFVGGSVQNISVYIYSMKRFSPKVNALSTLIFFAIGIVVVLFEVLTMKKSDAGEDKASKKGASSVR